MFILISVLLKNLHAEGGCYVLNMFVAAWITAPALDATVISVTLPVLTSCFSGIQNNIQLIWEQNWVLPRCFSFQSQ
jgi:hypothetical protein